MTSASLPHWFWENWAMSEPSNRSLPSSRTGVRVSGAAAKALGMIGDAERLSLDCALINFLREKSFRWDDHEAMVRSLQELAVGSEALIRALYIIQDSGSSSPTGQQMLLCADLLMR